MSENITLLCFTIPKISIQSATPYFFSETPGSKEKKCFVLCAGFKIRYVCCDKMSAKFIKSINEKSRFDQLAIASSSTPP